MDRGSPAATLVKKIISWGGTAISVCLLNCPLPTKAVNYDFYVDQGNDSGIEDGSTEHPFDTITEALEAAENNDESRRKIYVHNGEYRENIMLPKGAELFGENKKKTILLGKDANGKHYEYVVKMRHKTKLKNVKIKYGKIGILVTKNSRVKISKCLIQKTRKVGIEVEKTTKKKNRYKFYLRDSKIYNNKRKGLYIRERKIEIQKSEIYNNDEEGIDLRKSVVGKIKNNEIHGNGEGGIEMELRGIKLKITNNDIKNNSASGIAVQYRGKNRAGNVVIKRSEIVKNHHYGIKCEEPSGGAPPYFYYRNAVTLLNSVVYDNASGSFSFRCHF
jgi:hypothetical protein